jgi:hypothetical protein
MTMRQTAVASLVLTAAAFAASAAPVESFSLGQHEISTGVNSMLIGKGVMDVLATTSVRDFARKTVNGVTGVGVRGGSVSGEIDREEVVSFYFDGPVAVSELQISFLYDNGQFGDNPAEKALISTDLGDFYLSVVGPDTAAWTGSGTSENLSLATEAGGGHWRLSGENIFGGAITELHLSSGNPGKGGRFGDFSFVSLNAGLVPTPGAVALLGLGGLTAAKRRRG